MGCIASSPDAPDKNGVLSHMKEMHKKNIKAEGIEHSQFIMSNRGKIADSYDMDKKKIGTGAYGDVCKATEKETGATRAIKSIPKAKMTSLEPLALEINIMKLMDHPNIVKLYEVFEDHRCIYLVMELCTGGELFDRVIEVGHFTETHAANLMQQMIHAVHYMHKMNVCHRDLKPENFLFTDRVSIDESVLKVIDFGLSRTYRPGQIMTTKVGSPYYTAPQVLSGKYDEMIDLWSIGVIMYVMLCGYPPFVGDNDLETLTKVRSGSFTFKQEDWKNISDDAKQLIRMLLKVNPRDRFDADQAQNHMWIKNKAPKATDMHIEQNFVAKLRAFRSANKLKKAALHIIAGQLNESQIKALRDTFVALDSDGDGQLTVVELREGIAKAGLEEIPPDLQEIMESVDVDGSGEIDYTEFLAAALDKRMYLQEDVCWAAFRIFDHNHDGKISQDDLKHVLNKNCVASAIGDTSIQDIMLDCDGNGDGDIDFNEFMTMMRAGNA